METVVVEEKAPPSLPRLGSPAPEFEADTTHGAIRLEDFRGIYLAPTDRNNPPRGGL